MILTTKELKIKWNKEKDSYYHQEVGSGVQKFVKDILKSSELFNLREGMISTALEQRRYEFTEESKTKAARQVDIVIFINQDIVIPVEVEKIGQIKTGLGQLLQYQLDLDKKYGILTDGNIWQFYNNTFLIKELTLMELLDDQAIFKVFWHEYIKPENYYINFFEERGQLKLLPEDLSVENRRQDFFRDITTLIRSFQSKLKIEGYLQELEAKNRKKIATEITYAYIIQFILYKTLVDNAFGDFPADFKDREKNIYELLKTKQYGKILGIIGGISENISKDIYRPFKKEQEFINQKLHELIYQPKNELHDVSPWLDIFIFIKKYNLGNVKNDIFGYIYENYLKELYQETQKGQYFTDPAIVNFMLDQIGYTKENLKKRVTNSPEEDSISIIDPACGSGTFLYSATDRLIDAVPDGTERASKKIEELVSENIFGLDIEEFPLYLAEMNILMRMLPIIINEKYNNPIDKKIKVFKTRDSIAEFINDKYLANTISDLNIKGQQTASFNLAFKSLDLGYTSFMRSESDISAMKDSMRPPRRKFDFVIGNPPYIGYNECSKQGIEIFKQMKKKEVSLSNIFDVNLHSTPLNRKKYSPKPNLYVFFIALSLRLLKENGYICFIIPQTILTSGDLDVIRYHLSKFTTIKKIITFSGKMFVGRGIRQKNAVATSSLVIVVKKAKPAFLNQVEIINYEDAGDDIVTSLENISQNRKISRKLVKQDDLLTNINSWNFIKYDRHFVDFCGAYKDYSDDISIYYNHAWARNHFKNQFYFDIGFSLSEKLITKNPDNNSIELLDFRNFIGQSIFIPTSYYPNDKKQINLTQNSQGYDVLNQKYKIIWSVKNPDKFYFTDHNIIFHMGRASIICSDNKNEIFYLFSLLDSSVNKKIIIKNTKSENEKDYLIPIKSIKQFVRVPKITEVNQFIKDEIIRETEETLGTENNKLSDLVDFSQVLQQKFNAINCSGGRLKLLFGDKEIICKVTSDWQLAEKTVNRFVNENKGLSGKLSNLNDLKNYPAIDFEKQKQVKDYIDDLIFALYFNIPIAKIGLGRADEIKKLCFQNKFYKIVEESVK